MKLIERIAIRAEVDGKWGSFTLKELLDLGEQGQVMDWLINRLFPKSAYPDYDSAMEGLAQMLPYGSYTALKDPDAESDFREEGDLHKAKLRELADELKKRLPASMGFLMLLFDYSVGEDHGATFYASTASRAESIVLLEEHIAHLKETDDGTGEHQETKTS